MNYEEECREIHAREFREQLDKCFFYLDDNPPAAGWEALTYLYSEDLLGYVLSRSDDYPSQDFQELLDYCAANFCGYRFYHYDGSKSRFGHSISDDLFADLEERVVREAKELLESI